MVVMVVAAAAAVAAVNPRRRGAWRRGRGDGPGAGGRRPGSLLDPDGRPRGEIGRRRRLIVDALGRRGPGEEW